jgi:hypothetical protein
MNEINDQISLFTPQNVHELEKCNGYKFHNSNRTVAYSQNDT